MADTDSAQTRVTSSTYYCAECGGFLDEPCAHIKQMVRTHMAVTPTVAPENSEGSVPAEPNFTEEVLRAWALAVIDDRVRTYPTVAETSVPAEKCATCGNEENLMIHSSARAEGRAPGSGHPFKPASTDRIQEAREAAINASLLPYTPAGERLNAYITKRVDALIAAVRESVEEEIADRIRASERAAVLAEVEAGVAEFIRRGYTGLEDVREVIAHIRNGGKGANT